MNLLVLAIYIVVSNKVIQLHPKKLFGYTRVKDLGGASDLQIYIHSAAPCIHSRGAQLSPHHDHSPRLTV